MIGALRSLGAAEQKVLYELLHHLARVAVHQEENKMTESNLAIVFSPTLGSLKRSGG